MIASVPTVTLYFSASELVALEEAANSAISELERNNEIDWSYPGDVVPSTIPSFIKEMSRQKAICAGPLTFCNSFILLILTELDNWRKASGTSAPIIDTIMSKIMED